MTKLLASGAGVNSFGPIRIELTRNSGLAFSLPLPAAWATGIVAGLVVLVGALAVRHFIRGSTWLPWAFVFVGGLANLLDRLRSGAVIDFIAIGPLPIFNVADCLIVGGLAALLWPRLTPRSV